MIIEITGSPGVGKSTIISQYYKQAEHEAIFFSDDLILEHFMLGTVAHRCFSKFMADVLLILIFLRHFNKYKKFILYVKDTMRLTSETTYVKINVIRNVLLKIARFEFIRKQLSDRIVIVDEGISHIPFNLINYADDKYGAEAKTKLESILAMVESQLKMINVIIIVRKQCDVLDAVLTRGHKRINSKSLYTIDRFNNYNSLLSKEYINMSDDYFISKTVYAIDGNGEIQDKSLKYLIKRVIEI